MDPEDRTRRWCSTLVDQNGNHIAGRNEYGLCDITCPIHSDGEGRGYSSSFPYLNQIDQNYISNNNAPLISTGRFLKYGVQI